ncbi:hypothetical protein B0181_07900 [Moraxella caviae]|uniref:3'-5' exoribonuclease Rv2179c-like domain-containing protein n=2 Tax=Moraxella caviae TaxID=34060 RepID=A0A1S9ZYT9_9GAMM|nr:hypothetical protein B0181_07900 [Moraxella caviae]STZ13687.1 Uncharacterised protein [Moraxella caviae]
MQYGKTVLVSIDVETLSADPLSAALVSAGMAAKVLGGEMLDTFYAEIDPKSALGYGTQDDETLAWWEKQSDEAKSALNRGTDSVEKALTALHQAITRIGELSGGDFVVIARAPTFDCTILRQHFKQLGLDTPWHYWQERDHRTFESALTLAANWSTMTYKQFVQGNVAHDALKDALAQLNYVDYLVNAVMTVNETI